jgi:hypothetical protein
MGVADHVLEHPQRVPYFEALQVLRDAHMLLLPGSDDPQYTPSKIYPYILARRPLLAVLHENSGACDVLRSTGAGTVATFGGGRTVPAISIARGGEILRPFTSRRQPIGRRSNSLPHEK